MSQPPAPLGPRQRQHLLGQIATALASAAPPGWRQLRAEYRAAGRHVEADLVVTGPDGTPGPVPPSPQAVQLLGTLRAGMYQPGRGTWLAAAVVVLPGAPPRTEFAIDEEPRWRRVPPPIGFQDELRFFPREDRFVPGWLRRRAAGEGPGQAASDAEYGLRTPRVYDGLDEQGRPVVNRPPLPRAERDRMLGYLSTAPVVLAARSYDTDAFAPDREPGVPLNFRTDGTWVWPGAVVYHLREHGVAPDPELAAHIRARGFALPEVSEPARELAIATVTGQPPTAG